RPRFILLRSGTILGPLRTGVGREVHWMQVNDPALVLKADTAIEQPAYEFHLTGGVAPGHLVGDRVDGDGVVVGDPSLDPDLELAAQALVIFREAQLLGIVMKPIPRRIAVEALVRSVSIDIPEVVPQAQLQGAAIWIDVRSS